MHLLKLKLIHGKGSSYFYTIYYASFPELSLLLDFFRDFAPKGRIDFFKFFLESLLEVNLTGDVTIIDKKPNGKLAISFLYASNNDNSSLEIDSDVLLKVMELYLQAREKTPAPEEIIIKFDEHMQNPTVETI